MTGYMFCREGTANYDLLELSGSVLIKVVSWEAKKKALKWAGGYQNDEPCCKKSCWAFIKISSSLELRY